jgi:hypothetical protein
MGGGLLKSSVEEKVRKTSKYILDYYIPDPINKFLESK